ncbi:MULTISPECIES: acyl-CoA dehydrogenase family protein [Dietzia]|uniref:Acyl-CoA dehydrogenase family protein n=1 Tax=Dietzia maris TaxID=37915 RepID=A0ABT8GXK9_9ACTN|nr:MULTISPECIES: acyl-CoA dehydrogenase family protein [Dietzia]MDN4504930.1 acyl-CoA dehydrogenase family protein [Dietzia maris]MDV3356496.1 acyl-CoA dehydrogenase family protein [Dietzia sp. IN118]
MSDATDQHAASADPADQHAATAGPVVDEDLLTMMGDVLSAHNGADVEPDPAAVWQSLVEVGLARLTAPEAGGGSGAGWTEAAALLRLSAAAGVAVPYAETDLVVGPLRRAAALDDATTATATLAVIGPDGHARRVAWAGGTDTVLFVRRAGGDDDEVGGRPAGGYELAEVPTVRTGVEAVRGVSAVPLADVSPPEDATWTAVDTAAVEAAVLRGALARAVQCVGAAEGMLDSAVAHTTQRNQFGRPLSRFQSVQNLVVDIAAETVLARAAVDQAVADALTTDLGGPLSGFRVAAARSVVSQALAVAVRNAHQVHGAMGTTHEHTLHRLTLPALQWRGEFGSATFWESLLADAAVDGGMDGAWPMVVEGTPIDGAAVAWLDRVTRAHPAPSRDR